MLVRTVECLDGRRRGRARLRAGVRLRPEPADLDAGRRAQHAADATGAGHDVPARLGSRTRRSRANRVRGRHVLEAGDRAFCALSWAEGLAAPQNLDEAAARIDSTTRFWRDWLSNARIPDHRLRDPIQRSALTIKGLTYMPTGATVAALTTSLPETPGGERNWDYRYTWIRDTTFTLQALHFLNLDWEAGEFMEFVADLEPTEDGSLQIMYGIDGRRDLRESTRDDLTGYCGRDGRCGSATAPSTSGRTTSSAPCSTRSCSTRGTASGCRGACGRSCRRRRSARPRSGRTRPGDLGGARQAAALRLLEADVLGRARPRGASWRRSAATPTLQEKWRATADEIRADILEHGVRDGVLRQHYETDSLDASTLLAAIFGFLPGDDETLHEVGAGDRQRPHRGRLRPALPDRRDRRRPVGQGGHLPDLLVLARVGARGRRRAAGRDAT